MYGLAEYYIAREIFEMMNEGSDDVDPMLNSLAHKLRHDEMMAEAAQPQPDQPERNANLRHRLGSLLVTLGQRMQAVPEPDAYPRLENELCV